MDIRRFRHLLCLFWKIYLVSFSVDGIFVQESVPVNFRSLERGVNDIHPNRLRLSFRAHGLYFNIYLYRSNNISLDSIPTFILGNHSESTPTNQTMTFYRDRFRQSLFSLSTTDTGPSMTGHVIRNDHSYYLKPEEDDHYIVEKRAHRIFLGNDVIQPNRSSRARRNIRSPIPPDDVIEVRIQVLVLLDYSLYKTFYQLYQDNAILEMKKYFAHVINGVDTIYRNIRDPYLNIRVLIAGFVISKMPSTSPWYENNIVRHETDVYGKLIPIVNSRDAIQDMSFKIVEYKRNYSFPEFDHAMSFTGYDLASMDGNKATLGVAYSNSICEVAAAWSNSISLVEETRSFESILTAAHELAHSLGVGHDGYHPDISCPERHNFLMAASTELSESGSHLNMYHFSCCSKQQLREVLRSGEKDCIVEPPIVNNNFTQLASGDPGQVYSYNQQCVLRVGRGSQFCQWVHVKFPDIVCEELWCTDPLFPLHCVYAGEPVYGASCSSGPWCIDGTCTPQEVGKHPPINHMLICCPLPEKLIENGHMTTYDHELWVDAEAHYSCDAGYSAHNGDMVRTCGSDARWSGQLPVCRKTVNATRLDSSSGYATEDRSTVWPHSIILNSGNQWETIPTQLDMPSTVQTLILTHSSLHLSSSSSTSLSPLSKTSNFSSIDVTPSSSSSDISSSLVSPPSLKSPTQVLSQSLSLSFNASTLGSLTRHDSSPTVPISATPSLVCASSPLPIDSPRPHSSPTVPISPTQSLVSELSSLSNNSFHLGPLTRHDSSSIVPLSPTQSLITATSPLSIDSSRPGSLIHSQYSSTAPISPTQSLVSAPSSLSNNSFHLGSLTRHDSLSTVPISPTQSLVSAPSLSINSSRPDSSTHHPPSSTVPIPPTQSLISAPSSFSNNSFHLGSLDRHDSSSTVPISPTPSLVSAPSPLSINSSRPDSSTHHHPSSIVPVSPMQSLVTASSSLFNNLSRPGSLVHPHLSSPIVTTQSLVSVPPLFSNNSSRLDTMTVPMSSTKSRVSPSLSLFIDSSRPGSLTSIQSSSIAPISPTQAQTFAPSSSSFHTLSHKPAAAILPSQASPNVSMALSSSTVLLTVSYSSLYPLPSSSILSPLTLTPSSLPVLLRPSTTPPLTLPLTSLSSLPGPSSSQPAFSSLTLPSLPLSPSTLTSPFTPMNTLSPIALLPSSIRSQSSFSSSPLLATTELPLTPISLNIHLSPDDLSESRSSLEQSSLATKSVQDVTPSSLLLLEIPVSESLLPSSRYILISPSSSPPSPLSSAPPSSSLSSLSSSSSSSSSILSPSSSLPPPPPSSSSPTSPSCSSSSLLSPSLSSLSSSLSSSPSLLSSSSESSLALPPPSLPSSSSSSSQSSASSPLPSLSSSSLLSSSLSSASSPVSSSTTDPIHASSSAATDLMHASSTMTRINTSRDIMSTGALQSRDTENHLRIETGDILSQHPASYIQATSSSLLNLMSEVSSSLPSSKSSRIRTGTFVTGTGVTMDGSLSRESSHARKLSSVTLQTVRMSTMVHQSPEIHPPTTSDVTNVGIQATLSPTLTSRVGGTTSQLPVNGRNTTSKPILPHRTIQTAINSTMFASELNGTTTTTDSTVKFVTKLRESKITEPIRTINKVMTTSPPEATSKCSSTQPLSLVSYTIVATTLMLLRR